MKGEFARIFEIDGWQVLVRSGKGSDDEPCITASMSTTVGFINLSFGYEDSEEGEDKRDHAMQKILSGDEAVPRRVFEQVKEMGLLDGGVSVELAE